MFCRRGQGTKIQSRSGQGTKTGRRRSALVHAGPVPYIVSVPKCDMKHFDLKCVSFFFFLNGTLDKSILGATLSLCPSAITLILDCWPKIQLTTFSSPKTILFLISLGFPSTFHCFFKQEDCLDLVRCFNQQTNKFIIYT
jgi:hypothetical protein